MTKLCIICSFTYYIVQHVSTITLFLYLLYCTTCLHNYFVPLLTILYNMSPQLLCSFTYYIVQHVSTITLFLYLLYCTTCLHNYFVPLLTILYNMSPQLLCSFTYYIVQHVSTITFFKVKTQSREPMLIPLQARREPPLLSCKLSNMFSFKITMHIITIYYKHCIL